MEKDLKYWIALSFVNGVGDVLTKSLYARFRGAEEVFKASRGELSRVEGMRDKTIDAILASMTGTGWKKRFKRSKQQATRLSP